jgi:calcineurin-like phosphoesterase family protein
MIFYTSDLHLCDEKIRKVCNRPFDSIQSMNRVLTRNWNERISDADTVYILGDIFPCDGYNVKDILDLVKKLNGEKILVAGNHDDDYRQPLNDSGLFKDIKHMAFVRDLNKEVVLCHYPLMTWRNDEKGSVHLYGHIHNKNLPEIRRYYKGKSAYNVGLDVRNFVPLTLYDILEGEK